MVKIFIDPGHGGSDPGAVGNGLQEKNLTLQIAKEVQQMLQNEYENVTIRMSRTGDQTLSLSSRSRAANSWGADYFLSIHINAGGGTGFESFIYSNPSSRTRSYQDAIHSEIMKQIDMRDRGQKRANFHVIRETVMPAILTESGFIDTASDANKLKSSEFIKKLARGHVNGLAKALNLKKKSGSTNEPSPENNEDSNVNEPPNNSPRTLYKVQIGAFAERANADELAEKAIKAGFNVYIVTDSDS